MMKNQDERDERECPRVFYGWVLFMTAAFIFMAWLNRP